MAPGATHLLLPVLLMLLAPGSWEQKLQSLHKLEGETVSVECPYQFWAGSNMARAWCKYSSARTCTMLATSPRLLRVPSEPRSSIRDYPRSRNFIVTMTELRAEDSGVYSCAFSTPSEIYLLSKIHLVVSRASTAPTTTWTSATSTVTDSPQDNWHLIVPSSTVAVVLLLVLTVLVILYFRKARGRAGKGEDKPHIYDSIAGQKEQTTEHRTDSSGQRRSQLSWGSNQQMGSDKDSGAVCYASLIHLNHFGLEDPIYINTHPNPRPMPDPFLTVEYTSIAGNRPQRSKLTALEGETQELKVDFTGQ